MTTRKALLLATRGRLAPSAARATDNHAPILGAMRRVLGIIAALLAGLAIWIVRPRRMPHPVESDSQIAPPAPLPAAESVETPTVHQERSALRQAVTPAMVTLIGVVSLAIGLAIRPPSLDLNVPADVPGAIDVYVSDPEVEVDLDLQIYDWAIWNRDDLFPPRPEDGGHAVRMILWIRGLGAVPEPRPVKWAVVLTGGAQYLPPLPYDPSTSRPTGPPMEPEDFTGATMRVLSDAQIIEGIALVGAGAITERPADWDGQAVADFLYHNGSYPDFGSQILVRLPQVNGGPNIPQPQWGYFPAKEEMVGPEVFRSYVGLGSGSIPEFIRVEYSEPPLQGSQLTWGPDPLSSGATALLIDIEKAQSETFRSDLSLAILGFAGAGLLTALGAWVALILRARSGPV